MLKTMILFALGLLVLGCGKAQVRPANDNSAQTGLPAAQPAQVETVITKVPPRTVTIPASVQDHAQVPVAGVAGQAAAVMADVNGRKISKDEVDRMIAARLEQRRGAPPGSGPTEADLRREALNELVRKALLRGAAEREGVTVSDQERAEAEEHLRDVNNNPQPTRDAIMEEAMVRKLFEKKFATKSFAPTEEEIDTYAKNMKNRITVPERVVVCEILVGVDAKDDDAIRQQKKQTAEAMRSRLLGGADFAQLAAAASDSPSKSNGGVLSPFVKGTHPGAFDEHAFLQKVSEIGPVFMDQRGYCMLKVLERIPQNTLSRGEIIRMLEEANREKAFADYGDQLMAEYAGASQP